MTELRKKAIDTCNRALEVLIAAYTVLKQQRVAAVTAGKDDPEDWANRCHCGRADGMGEL